MPMAKARLKTNSRAGQHTECGTYLHLECLPLNPRQLAADHALHANHSLLMLLEFGDQRMRLFHGFVVTRNTWTRHAWAHM